MLCEHMQTVLQASIVASLPEHEMLEFVLSDPKNDKSVLPPYWNTVLTFLS